MLTIDKMIKFYEKKIIELDNDFANPAMKHYQLPIYKEALAYWNQMKEDLLNQPEVLETSIIISGKNEICFN
jgi:hypothetical protein